LLPCNARAVNAEYRLACTHSKTYPAVWREVADGQCSTLYEKDEILMYIVAIGWIYVALMMAITETNIVAGVATFLLYGVAPVSIVLYIMGTPGRRQRRKAEEARTEQAAKEEEKEAVKESSKAGGAGKD
jgi:hypothetical protein